MAGGETAGGERVGGERVGDEGLPVRPGSLTVELKCHQREAAALETQISPWRNAMATAWQRLRASSLVINFANTPFMVLSE